jgi:hypothetical protein
MCISSPIIIVYVVIVAKTENKKFTTHVSAFVNMQHMTLFSQPDIMGIGLSSCFLRICDIYSHNIIVWVWDIFIYYILNVLSLT